ncbi:uracil-DNA glycosylase family protein [Sphingomonas sp.]|uniref:uracil-DNA glycosylase family protein n=1 Tax=Sphingomonas sp. TaxID=28214 RepID=UPI00307F9D57
MGIEGVFDWRSEAASALQWWRDAGVDVLVDDQPRDWMAAPAPRVAPDAAVISRPAEPEAPAPLPATLAAFVDWRYGAGAPEAVLGAPILQPAGEPDAPLMVVTDLPEFDGAEPELLSGPAGRLFDRMLAAIGTDRDSVYLVPLCAARPITGQVPRDLEDQLGRLLQHHIALAAPARLLVLGQTANRAIPGIGATDPGDGLTPVNLLNAQIRGVATFHPRFLLTKPAAKADVWKTLQNLIKEQSQ